MRENNGQLPPWETVQGIYVHLPFCRRKCLYCDFISYAGCSTATMEAYAAAVCREIASGKLGDQPVSAAASIYFGGGTPSLLPAAALQKIVTALRKYGYWRSPAEATIEVNPGTVTAAKLRELRALGFDRVSIGIQSLNDGELRALGRIHTAGEALATLDWARQAGFQRISADVMYGLPGQTPSSLQQSLERLAEENPEHLSVYSLILEEGTPLAAMVQRGEIRLPGEEAQEEMSALVGNILAARGYRRYEISNYARDGGESRHNQIYWHYWPYAAFGAAACAFDGRCRRTGAAGVEDYIAQAERRKFCYAEEALDAEQRLGEFMFMGLRMAQGVSLIEAQERFHVDVLHKYGRAMRKWLEVGLLCHDAGEQRLRLSARGMELGNQIFEIFVTV